jgi:hypothetical protein
LKKVIQQKRTPAHLYHPPLESSEALEYHIRNDFYNRIRLVRDDRKMKIRLRFFARF